MAPGTELPLVFAPLRVSPKSPLGRQSIAEWRIDVRGFESLEHEVNSTDAQHRFAGVRATLAGLAVATTTAKPGGGANRAHCSFVKSVRYGLRIVVAISGTSRKMGKCQ
jgi:hypothetical protein